MVAEIWASVILSFVDQLVALIHRMYRFVPLTVMSSAEYVPPALKSYVYRRPCVVFYHISS